MSRPRTPTRPPRPRAGMSLIEVVFAMLILTGVLLVLGNFSGQFARANGQAHLIISANEIAAARMDEIRTQPTYAALDTLATTPGKFDSMRVDNTTFLRFTRMKHVGGNATSDSVDYKVMTVIVTHPSMKRTVAKTTAIAAF